ncbi:MAG: hypothetical protein IT342_05450 [Candidatus Melainabacteria bacterium]|nr:hypothetical protein [Candidatus Melainabacteria bacterium]
MSMIGELRSTVFLNIKMKTVYERLIKSLGQPPDGVVFSQFVAELGCELIEDFQTYSIPTLGVTLFVVDGFFSVVLIELDTQLTRSGSISRYEGDLPNGIEQDDGPETISQKLSARPLSAEQLALAGLWPRDFQNVYMLPPLVLNFNFAADTKNLSSILISLSSQPSLARYSSPSGRL